MTALAKAEWQVTDDHVSGTSECAIETLSSCRLGEGRQVAADATPG